MPLFTDDLGAPFLPSVFTLISATTRGSFKALRTYLQGPEDRPKALSYLLWPLTSEYPCRTPPALTAIPWSLALLTSAAPSLKSLSLLLTSNHKLPVLTTPTLPTSRLSVPSLSPAHSQADRVLWSIASPHFSQNLQLLWPLTLSHSDTITAPPPLSPESTTSVAGHCQRKFPSLLQSATTYLWSLTLAGPTRHLGDNPSPHSSLRHIHTPLKPCPFSSSSFLTNTFYHCQENTPWKNPRQAASLLQLTTLPQTISSIFSPNLQSSFTDSGKDLCIPPPPPSAPESRSTCQLSPGLQALSSQASLGATHFSLSPSVNSFLWGIQREQLYSPLHLSLEMSINSWPTAPVPQLNWFFPQLHDFTNAEPNSDGNILTLML